MKKLGIAVITCILAFFATNELLAGVTVTAATGGGSLSPCAYTTLGNIVITEASNTDIPANQISVILILTAPAGFEFNAGTGSATCIASRDVTINGISVTTSKITLTFTSDGIANAIDIITISGIQAKASNATPVASSGNILRTTANPGTATISGITKGTTNFGSFGQIANLSYASSAVTQTNLTKVDAYSCNDQIIGIQVVVTGCGGTLNATSFTLNTTGTTNPATDIDTARIYYTGTSSSFATTTFFGKLAFPSGSFTINGTAALASGTNYFWLTYDCLSATNNHNIDAECTSVTVGGTGHSPSPTTVAGSRNIIQHCPAGFKDAGNTIIINGGFDALPGESGSGFASSYTYVANVAPDPAIDNTECWPEETYSISDKASNVHSHWSRQTKGIGGSGKFMIINGAPENDVTIWSENNLPCRPNIVYFFSTWICSVHPLNVAELRFSINDVQQGPEFSPSADTANKWLQYYTTWSSDASTTVSLKIVNKNIIANGNDYGLDDIYMCPCMSELLPVELLYFHATEITENEVNLDWATASESNNDFFTVEKSYDATNFKIIGTIAGAGNSNTKLLYEDKDKEGFEGHPVCYYRLKQTDFDGKFKYSDIVSLKNNKVNPSVTAYNDNGNITVNISQYQSCCVQISVIDLLGQVLFTTEKTITEGNNTFNLNTSLKNKSVYFIRLQDLTSGSETVLKAD